MVGTLRGRLLTRDAVSSKGKRAGARNTMQSAHQSTAATFRNIPAHNAIVIMQATQAAFHKQRKGDTINNASVILLCSISRNHGIVISRFGSQAFVTFRNISSAYLSYRGGLCSTFVLCDSSRLAIVRMYYSTPVLLCGYDVGVILLYRYMIICR
jgi:hypothetical protein